MVCRPASRQMATNGTPRQMLAVIDGQPRELGLAEEIDVAVDQARSSPAPS